MTLDPILIATEGYVYSPDSLSIATHGYVYFGGGAAAPIVKFTAYIRRQFISDAGI